MNNDFYEALTALEKEKGIKKEYMLEKIRAAIQAAVKKEKNLEMPPENIDAAFDEEKKTVRFFVRKTVVEDVADPLSEITLEDARKINRKYDLGSIVEVDLDPAHFGRIAAKVGKNVIVQGINEAVYGSITREFTEKTGEIVTGVVERIDLMWWRCAARRRIAGACSTRCFCRAPIRGWFAACLSWRCRRCRTARWRLCRSPARRAAAPRWP